MSESYISKENTNRSNSSEFATKSNNKIDNTKNKETKMLNTTNKEHMNIITYTTDRIVLWNTIGRLAGWEIPYYCVEMFSKKLFSKKELKEFNIWINTSYACYLRLQTNSLDISDIWFTERDFDTVDEIQKIYDQIRNSEDKVNQTIIRILAQIFKQIKQKGEKNNVVAKQ